MRDDLRRACAPPLNVRPARIVDDDDEIDDLVGDDLVPRFQKGVAGVVRRHDDDDLVSLNHGEGLVGTGQRSSSSNSLIEEVIARGSKGGDVTENA